MALFTQLPLQAKPWRGVSMLNTKMVSQTKRNKKSFASCCVPIKISLGNDITSSADRHSSPKKNSFFFVCSHDKITSVALQQTRPYFYCDSTDILSEKQQQTSS